VAKEGVITRVRKHNSNLMDQQAQYKEVICLLNANLKDLREKLEEAGRQKEKLEGELTASHKQVETAGTDAVQKFKIMQSFIDSCAEYYGTGFDDCLKQVASAFPELDLSGITLDDPVSMTPTGDTVADKGDEPINLDLLNDDGVILAQPATNPPIPASNPSVEPLNVEEPNAKDKADGASKDAPAA